MNQSSRFASVQLTFEAKSGVRSAALVQAEFFGRLRHDGMDVAQFVCETSFNKLDGCSHADCFLTPTDNSLSPDDVSWLEMRIAERLTRVLQHWDTQPNAPLPGERAAMTVQLEPTGH